MIVQNTGMVKDARVGRVFITIPTGISVLKNSDELKKIIKKHPDLKELKEMPIVKKKINTEEIGKKYFNKKKDK